MLKPHGYLVGILLTHCIKCRQYHEVTTWPSMIILIIMTVERMHNGHVHGNIMCVCIWDYCQCIVSKIILVTVYKQYNILESSSHDVISWLNNNCSHEIFVKHSFFIYNKWFSTKQQFYAD